jgi:hypothetical protein
VVILTPLDVNASLPDTPGGRVLLFIIGALDCVPHSSFANLIEIVQYLERKQLKVCIHLSVVIDRSRLMHGGGSATHRRRLTTSNEDVLIRVNTQLTHLRRVCRGDRVRSWRTFKPPLQFPVWVLRSLGLAPACRLGFRFGF